MATYLRCEFVARDLDSRLLIASYLLRSSAPVIVGQHWAMGPNFGSGAPSVHVFATAHKIQAAGMGACRTHGNRIVAMDEEALALRYERTILDGVDSSVAENCDVFAFQDKSKERLIRTKIPSVRGVVTGSARIELLRPGAGRGLSRSNHLDLEAERIGDGHGLSANLDLRPTFECCAELLFEIGCHMPQIGSATAESTNL